MAKLRFAQLLRDPETSWVRGDIAVQDSPVIVSDHEEAIQDLEGERWGREEVHCGNASWWFSKNAFQRLAGSGFLRHALHARSWHGGLHQVVGPANPYENLVRVCKRNMAKSLLSGLN